MKYCPKCHSEFEKDVNMCVDCSLSLVNEKPDEEQITWQDLVVVYETDNAQMAELARIELHQNDIITFIENENFGSLVPLPIIADIEVAVRPQDEEKAKEILSVFSSE